MEEKGEGEGEGEGEKGEGGGEKGQDTSIVVRVSWLWCLRRELVKHPGSRTARKPLVHDMLKERPSAFSSLPRAPESLRSFSWRPRRREVSNSDLTRSVDRTPWKFFGVGRCEALLSVEKTHRCG